MYLVDDVHLILRLRRHEDDLVTDAADIVYAVVTGGIHLDDVQKGTVNDTLADLALVAGVAVHRVQAVDGTGEHFRDRGLAGTSRSTEQIGMPDLTGYHGLAQRSNRVCLLDDIVKIHRTVESV